MQTGGGKAGMKKMNRNKELVVVLGMHRSATSLTAMLLHEMGLYMGEEQDMLTANEHNREGYFERADVVAVHDEILDDYGRYWLSLSKSKAENCREDYRKRISQIIAKLSQTPSLLSAIKDPRLCLFEPFWREELKKKRIGEKIILVFRHPYEVAKSLETRDHMNYLYALKLWFYYNSSILNILLNIPADNVLVINHNEYFVNANHQIKKLISFLDIDCDNEKCAEKIKTDLRHNLPETMTGNDLYERVMELYDYLLDLERGTVTVSKERADYFSSVWENLYDTSYDAEYQDMPRTVYNTKKRSVYQLTHKKERLREAFCNYFNEEQITCISIYGDGTVADALYPVLENTGIVVKYVFEQKPKRNDVVISGKHVPVVQPGLQSDTGLIINTIVNHEKSSLTAIRENFPFAEVEMLNYLLFRFLEKS